MRIFFPLILERVKGVGQEREREKHIRLVASHTCPHGEWGSDLQPRYMPFWELNP